MSKVVSLSVSNPNDSRFWIGKAERRNRDIIGLVKVDFGLEKLKEEIGMSLVSKSKNAD